MTREQFGLLACFADIAAELGDVSTDDLEAIRGYVVLASNRRTTGPNSLERLILDLVRLALEARS